MATTGVSVWSLASDQARWTISGLFGDLLFSSSGDRLVLSEIDTSEELARSGRLRVVDPADGSNVQDPIELPATVGRVSAIDWWDHDETLVAGLGGTVVVKVFDLVSGELVESLNPEAEAEGSGGGNDTGLAVLRPLGLVATAGAGGVELRDMDSTGPLAQLAQLPPELVDEPGRWLVPAFSSDGETFVASTLLDEIAPFVYDRRDALLTPTPIGDVMGDAPDLLISVGDFTAHTSATGTEVRAGLDGAPVGPVMATVPISLPTLAALSPTGDRFAQAEGRAVTLYDTSSGDVVARLDDELPTPPEIPEFDFWALAFPTDGTTLVVWTAAGRASALVDAENGDVIWTSREMGRAYAMDGQRYLGSAADAGGITLHDPRTREVVAEPLIGHTALTTQLYPNHANSDLVVSAGRDGTSRVWDLESGQQLGRELPTELFGTRGWSPDGKTLANPGSSGFELWNYDTDSWVEIACQVVSRNLTSAEWSRLGPRTLDHRVTCPQYDIE